MEDLKRSHFLMVRDYMQFLLNNYLKEVTQESIEIAKEHDLSLLKFFKHLTEEEFFNYSSESLRLFLNSIIDDKVINETQDAMMRWRSDKIADIPQDQITLTDLCFVVSSRKRVFLKYLPYFTSDPELIIQIALGIEKMYSEIEAIYIMTYLEIHDNQLLKLNKHLQEFQEELQVTNEELKESHEEVQAINEELKEQIETRKAIEVDLEKEKNFFSLILNNINDAIVACDENGILSFFNEATRTLHGIKEVALPPEEWPNYYNLYDVDGETLLKKEDVPLFRAFNGLEVKNSEMIIKTKEGLSKSVLVNGGRMITSDGKIQGAVVAMHDITERKALAENKARLLAEEAVAREAKRQTEMLENFFHNAPVPVCILKGSAFKFTLVNKEYKENFFPNKNFQNKTFLEVFPELEGTTVLSILEDVFRTGKRFIGNEVPVDLDRGKGYLETGYFNFIYEPIFHKEEVDGIIILAYEVTELINSRLQFKELSDELAANNEELTAANEEIQASLEDLSFANKQLSLINADLDNFIYTASHDLKAPIANIEGLIKVLSRQLPPDNKGDVGQILDYINASIERFKITLKNLTQVVKIQKEDHPEVALNLNDIVEEVKLDLQLIIEESGAIIVSEGCENFNFHFSHKNFKSIIYNLISNAVKYSSPERRPMVIVGCHKEEEFKIITVKDNGLGMNLNNESKIFTMFQRLHNHVEGTGIGLYIVKKIIENNGGKIEVSSIIDEGSVFKVYLPHKL